MRKISIRWQLILCDRVRALEPTWLVASGWDVSRRAGDYKVCVCGGGGGWQLPWANTKTGWPHAAAHPSACDWACGSNYIKSTLAYVTEIHLQLCNYSRSLQPAITLAGHLGGRLKHKTCPTVSERVTEQGTGGGNVQVCWLSKLH